MRSNCLLAGLFFSFSFYASASTYWYNGDPNLIDGMRQEVGGLSAGLTYDDFVVGPGGMTVSGLFSNDFMSESVTQAFWEIRKGLSDTNAGTVVASGTTDATQTDIGLANFGFEVYRVEVDGLSLFLPSGRYWLAVAPVLTNSAHSSFVVTTSGADGVGSTQAKNGNSYYEMNGTFSPAYFWTSTQSSDGGFIDFSEGVIGSASRIPQVPEPSTAGLVTAAGAIVIGWRRRRSAI